MRTLLSLLFVLGFVCPLTAQETNQTTPKNLAVGMPVHTRINVAHRGASAVMPENTLPAYLQAIQDGATGAECDVYASADGIIFLSHDKTTKRTLGGGDQDITKMNYADIRKLDAGNWKGDKFKGIYAPTLDEYIDVLKGTNCQPVIEIKMDGIEQKVVDAVRKANLVDVATVIAFSQNVVKEIRRIEPKLSVAYLYSENLSSKGGAAANADRLAKLLIERCHALDTNILDLNHGILSKELIEQLQGAGIHVWCWTVDDEARMNQLLDWGIESITTNKPDLLTRVLKKREQ